MDYCQDHIQSVKDVVALREDVKYIKDAVCKHIVDSDCKGGYRDRVSNLESLVHDLNNRYWASALIGGVIGALIGSGANEALILLIKWLIGIK